MAHRPPAGLPLVCPACGAVARVPPGVLRAPGALACTACGARRALPLALDGLPRDQPATQRRFTERAGKLPVERVERR